MYSASAIIKIVKEEALKTERGFKMRKELINRTNEFLESTSFPNKLYFDEKVSDARYKNYRYFFKFYNTRSTEFAFKNQKELDSFLAERGF